MIEKAIGLALKITEDYKNNGGDWCIALKKKLNSNMKLSINVENINTPFF